MHNFINFAIYRTFFILSSCMLNCKSSTGHSIFNDTKCIILFDDFMVLGVFATI